tara:strand:+ start:1216 stop:1635 length:420 start_codon:yes stop_codon:yes gene_type:complete
LYERLRGREEINPLQERLLLLVHIRKRKIRLREIEIVAASGINADNKNHMVGLLESYRDMIFPGLSKVDRGPTEEEKAKKALVEESKKVYLVKPYDKVTDEAWQKLADKGGDAAFIAHRELRDRKRFKSRLKSKRKKDE